MSFELGSTIGDYQIVGILGAGGMGKVYKVRNVISDRIEAMKVLLPDLATAPELADRFLREIKTQASLEHPNIAALHTALRLDNQLVMLMEFVEGVTLEQKLKDGPLPMEQAVDYMSQVLSALDYAHQHGVVHRDIKPANMMLTQGGAVKLMDFGIAKGAGDHRLTMTGTTMGSLYYMSPEQIKGAAHIDSRADIYSAGVSLYELSTGKRPFDGDSQFAIMSAHLEKTPVPPIEIDPRLPQGLNDAILMSVAKDPEMRFQTAGAFRAALSSVLPAKQAAAFAFAAAVQAPPQSTEPQPLSTPAPVQPPPVTTAKSSGRRGLWMAAGAFAAALGVIAVIEFGPRKNTEASPPRVTVPQATTQSLAPQPPPAQVQPSATETSAAPAKSRPAEPAVAPPTVRAKPAARQTALQTITSQPAQSPAPQPTQQAQPQLTQAQQQMAPAQAAIQPPQLPTQQPAQPAGPSRAEIIASHERFAQLDARASGIRGTLQNLQRSQAASGLNLSSRFTQPASLMDSYMRAASDAIQANDLDSAKDFMTKAERQIETLEKLLNR